MGFNTTVVVLNDALGFIEDDQDFGKKLARAVRHSSGSRDHVKVSAGGFGGAAAVVETHHADAVVTVDVGGNTAVVVATRLDSRFPSLADEQTHKCFACGHPHAGVSFEDKYCTTCGKAAQERRTLYEALHLIDMTLRDEEGEKAKQARDLALEALIVAPMGERMSVLDWKAILEGRMTDEEAYDALKKKTDEMLAAGKRDIADRKKQKKV